MKGDYAGEGIQFAIDAQDASGCVWIRSTAKGDGWSRKLGQKEEVADVLSQWLRTVSPNQDPTLLGAAFPAADRQ